MIFQKRINELKDSISNYFLDTQEEYKACSFDNTMDTYTGIWRSSVVYGIDIINTEVLRKTGFRSYEKLLNGIDSFNRILAMDNYKIASIEFNYFEDCKVEPHIDDHNFDDRRIRIFIPIQYFNAPEIYIHEGNPFNSEETIKGYNDGEPFIFDCTLKHSANIKGKAICAIVDLLPKDISALDYIKYCSKPLMYYWEKTFKLT